MPSRPAPLQRADFRVLRPMQTRWMDNDQYGHVNNVAYYSYFDSAVNGYLMEATSSDTRELSAIGIVAETSCRFLSEGCNVHAVRASAFSGCSPVQSKE